MDVLASAVAAIIPSCIEPVWNNATYPFNATDNVKALDVATKTLMAREADVKREVESAQLQGMRQTYLVENWFNQVEAVKGEVEQINTEYAERSPCIGRRSLNCWSNYWISKNATKKLKVVQELCQMGQFEKVAIQVSPQVQELPIGSEVMPKEEDDLQSVLRYIDNHNIIGIWGMGGVGKTRLLQLVHNHYARSSCFDTVIFLTASRECSVMKLQDDLCKKYQFGRESDVDSQARIISQYLSSRNFLLLLDDLWDPIDLQKVGIPLHVDRVNNSKRNVIITTRSLRVCGLMDVKQPHKVTSLDFKEAYNLFREKVGEETIGSHPRIRSLAEEVVRELHGLPLAIITIGRAMYGKKDPREWEDAIDLLRRSRLHEIESATCDEEKIYYCLKFSYDSLETEELKNCFLACSLWFEDYEITKGDLIECWMGLGLLKPSTGRNIYNHGYTLIWKLLSTCLLEHAPSDSVKMHDVIRDMAIWLACDFGKQRDKWIVHPFGVNQVLHEKDSWCDTERATLLYPGKYISNHGTIPCEAKKLQLLMVHLTVYTSLEPLIEHLKFFSALTFLDLYHCNLHYFPPDILNLVNLKHLNLSKNAIVHVPEELKHLENLKYLLLRNNEIVSFPKGVISQLRELQVLCLFLSITFRSRVEYFTWLIEELGCLHNIKSLEIHLQHPSLLENLLKLPFLPIRFLQIDYFDEIDSIVIPSCFIANRAIQDNLCSAIIRGQSVEKLVIENYTEDLPCQLRNLEDLNILKMPKLKEIIWSRIKPKDLFVNLQRLGIGECHKLIDVSWVVYLPCLCYFQIRGCQNMVQAFNQSFASTSEIREEVVTPTFPSLKNFTLMDLPNLHIICYPSIMFPSLEKLYVSDCPILKKLPFRPETVPGNLAKIRASREWWEQLEWEQNELLTALQPFFDGY